MTGTPTILLIDDNVDDIALIRRALKRAQVDAEVEDAGDGLEGWRRLTERGARPFPSFVLLDLKMPRVNGFDFLARVRAWGPTRHVPVVVFTSSNEDGDVRRAVELGANSFVQKPIESGAFSETVKRVAEYWLGLNETESLPRPRDATVASR